VAAKFPGDQSRLQRMSLIEESQPRRVRMGYLAVVGTTKSELQCRVEIGAIDRPTDPLAQLS